MITTEKPWVVFLSIDYPFPPTSGSNWRTLSFVISLSKRYRIAAISFYNAFLELKLSDKNQLAGDKYIDKTFLFERPRKSFFKQLGQFFFSALPLNALKFQLPKIMRLIHQLEEELNPSFIFVDHINVMANITPNVKSPIIVSEQNVEYQLYRPAVGLKLIYTLIQRIKYRRYEKKCLGRARLIFFPSEREIQSIGSLKLNVSAICIPNTVLVGERIKLQYMLTNEPRFLFIGTLNYGPNQQGLSHFLKKIWPSVLKELSGAELYVIGGGLDLSNFSPSPGVKFLGLVQNVDPYYRESTSSIIPIYSGGGTRIKILEAFSKGLPVISTSKGAEGLAVIDNRHILICDTNEDFAKKMIYSASHPNELHTLANQAYDFAKREHGFHVVDKIFPEIDKILGSTINGGPP